MKSVEESSISGSSHQQRRHSQDQLKPTGTMINTDYKTTPMISRDNVDKSLSTVTPTIKKHDSQEICTDQQVLEAKPLEPYIEGGSGTAPRPSTSGLGGQRKKSAQVGLDYSNYQQQKEGKKNGVVGTVAANEGIMQGKKNNRDLVSEIRAKSSKQPVTRAKTSQGGPREVKFCLPRATEEIIEGIQTPEVSSIAEE